MKAERICLFRHCPMSLILPCLLPRHRNDGGQDNMIGCVFFSAVTVWSDVSVPAGEGVAARMWEILGMSACLLLHRGR